MANKVRYERVNLADIDTSSDDDDYGDLFAAERARGKGNKMGGRKKGGRCTGRCLRGSCLLLTVMLTLVVLAGVALYLDILKPLHISYFNDRGNHTVSNNHTLHNHTVNHHNTNTTDMTSSKASTITTLAPVTLVVATPSKDIQTTSAERVTEKEVVVTAESEDKGKEDGDRSTFDVAQESGSTWKVSSFGQPSSAQTSFGDDRGYSSAEQ